MRTGIRIGVDVGAVRVGVARSDPAGTLAVPVETLRRGEGDVAALVGLVAEYEALEVLVGLPVGLDGTEGAAAAAARAYATDVAARVDVPVRLVDERLSTVEATRGLREAGRDSRRGRAVVDQAAAVIIVQQALDTERSTGEPPGTVVTSDPVPARDDTAGRRHDPDEVT